MFAEKIVEKRIATKKRCFENIHPEIVPVLETIKRSNRKITLISNCFSEEVEIIRQSTISKYFDNMYLLFEQGIKKPNPKIFMKCVKELNTTPNECLYIEDGGDHELEAANDIGMTALQAGWYLKNSGRKIGGMVLFRCCARQRRY